MKEQWGHLDLVLNAVRPVNASLKLMLVLVVPLEKHKTNHRLDGMTNLLCTFLVVTNVKSSTLVKLLTTFVAGGIITNLKVKVLKEEKSTFRKIYINTLIVKSILRFSMMLHLLIRQTVLIPIKERITVSEP